MVFMCYREVGTPVGVPACPGRGRVRHSNGPGRRCRTRPRPRPPAPTSTTRTPAQHNSTVCDYITQTFARCDAKMMNASGRERRTTSPARSTASPCCCCPSCMTRVGDCTLLRNCCAMLTFRPEEAPLHCRPPAPFSRQSTVNCHVIRNSILLTQPVFLLCPNFADN